MKKMNRHGTINNNLPSESDDTDQKPRRRSCCIHPETVFNVMMAVGFSIPSMLIAMTSKKFPKPVAALASLAANLGVNLWARSSNIPEKIKEGSKALNQAGNRCCRKNDAKQEEGKFSVDVLVTLVGGLSSIAIVGCGFSVGGLTYYAFENAYPNAPRSLSKISFVIGFLAAVVQRSSGVFGGFSLLGSKNRSEIKEAVSSWIRTLDMGIMVAHGFAVIGPWWYDYAQRSGKGFSLFLELFGYSLCDPDNCELSTGKELGFALAAVIHWVFFAYAARNPISTLRGFFEQFHEFFSRSGLACMLTLDVLFLLLLCAIIYISTDGLVRTDLISRGAANIIDLPWAEKVPSWIAQVGGVFSMGLVNGVPVVRTSEEVMRFFNSRRLEEKSTLERPLEMQEPLLVNS